jgi:hypothetical protein
MLDAGLMGRNYSVHTVPIQPVCNEYFDGWTSSLSLARFLIEKADPSRGECTHNGKIDPDSRFSEDLAVLDSSSNSKFFLAYLSGLTKRPKGEPAISRPRCLSRNKTDPALTHLISHRLCSRVE